MRDIKLVKIERHGDLRGFFAETYSGRKFLELGINDEFVQDNHSLSRQVGTLRGLHLQAPPHAHAKLVRCGRGAIFDVAVDIRRGSPTYGHWEGYKLSAENGPRFCMAGYRYSQLTSRCGKLRANNNRTARLTSRFPR